MNSYDISFLSKDMKENINDKSYINRRVAHKDPHLISLLMCMSGLSKTELGRFVQYIKDNENKNFLELMKCDKWNSKSDKLWGEVNLLIHGLESSNDEIVKEFDFLKRCHYEHYLSFHNVSDNILELIIENYEKGSRSAKKGFSFQKQITDFIINIFGLTCESGRILKNDNNGKGDWDNIIFDLKIIAEITKTNSTGSNISNKAHAMISDREKLKDYKFCFVGGGHGWKSRKEDFKLIENNFDHIFEDPVEYLIFIKNTAGINLSDKFIRDEYEKGM